MDDFWKIYNSFLLMDKRGCGSVRRCDFFETISEQVTLDMRRTMTRGDLHERFTSSATEMTLSELLKRIWPNATDDDRKMMKQWATLYDAFSILSSDSFQGTHRDLKQLFDLLDLDGSQTLSMSELVRARILTKDEAHQLLKNWHEKMGSVSPQGQRLTLSLSFSDFCILVQQPLTEKYGQQKKESLPDDSWDVQKDFRSAFQASKKKSVQAVSRVSTRIKAVNALSKPLGFPRRSELYQAGSMVTAASS